MISNILKIRFHDILLIFLALMLTTFTDQYLNKQIELVIRSPEGLSNSIWGWALLTILNSLLSPLIISMFCSLAIAPNLAPKKVFFQKKFELALIETLRLWGFTTLWSLLFIIPGVYKYSVYMLSPLVVMFSKKYENGEIDALKYSQQIAKKFYGKLNFILLVFVFAIPVASSIVFDEFKLFNLHPWAATASVALDTLVIILFHYILLKYFLKYLNEVENGTYV